jgi:hypothetical protein
MSDPFDDFLGKALAPPERDPDRAFVARVHARVLLHEAIRAQRQSALQRLSLQLIALLAVVAAFVLLSQSPDVAAFVAESPAIVLTFLIALFSMLIALFASRAGSSSASAAMVAFSRV